MSKKTCLLIATSFFVICIAENPLVKTSNGLVQGTHQTSTNGRTFSAFEGIPFAKPPIQKLRFKEPQPVEPWSGVLIAESRYTCVQVVQMKNIGQEDCLYLNVYVPREKLNPEDKLDVIVHIHGGAFMVGSGHMFTGPKHFMDEDVIFITFNYRLGAFGFLSTEDNVIPGNFGLKDQQFVLQWIKDNIKFFGGNPDSVTLTGLSAGGASVHLHYFSQTSKDLFHKGFAQSGSALNPWVFQKTPYENAKKLATEVGCFNSSVRIMLGCLRQRPALQISEAVATLYPVPFLPLAPFSPVVEVQAHASFLTTPPYLQLLTKSATNLPLIMSTTTEEGILPSGVYYNQLETLDNEWKLLFPLMLEYDHLTDQKKEEISSELKEYYFNNEPITHDNYKNFIKLCTDRLFHLGAEKVARMQVKAGFDSVYFLMMGYRGQFSSTQSFTGSDDDLGVAHGDDVRFYYDTPLFPKLNEDDEEMKDVLVDMLVSFARTGKPEVENVNWKPVTDQEKFSYLYVKGPDDIEMTSVKELGPQKFWTSLALKEDENLYVVRDGYLEIL